jgi:hypothetical protein
VHVPVVIPDISPATHYELYHDWRAALGVCRSIPDIDPPDRVAFHMYWRHQRAGWFRRARPFGRKQLLPVKAFLATQDLTRCSLTVWSDVDLSSNPWLMPFAHHLTFREYRPEVEARGTALEWRPDILEQQDRRVWRDGDLFRILVLHNYGGVYVDMDVVLLRNLGALLGREFIYQWEDFDGVYNGALMHLRPGSRFARELIDGVLELKPANFAWGRDNLGRAVARGCPIAVFPSAFFDTDWLAEERFVAFRKTQSSANLHEGAFAWHWHNQWDAAIEDGSKFQLLEEEIDKRLAARGLLEQIGAGASSQ